MPESSASRGGSPSTSTGNLYIADFLGNRILEVDPSGNLTTLAGRQASGFTDGDAGTASFLFPAGVAVGPGGVLYVADYGNLAIRVITPVVTP